MKSFDFGFGITVTTINASGAAIKRPDVVSDAHLKFLDKLRESGKTNMFGAGPYVQQRFGVSRKDASTIVVYWMQSFEERHPE